MRVKFNLRLNTTGVVLVCCLLLWGGVVFPKALSNRVGNVPYDQVDVPQAQFMTLLITSNNDPDSLIARFLVPQTGITVTSVSFTGAPTAAGFFTGGAFGIDDGIILASGDVNNALPPNESGGTSTDFGLDGSEYCDALIPGYVSYDAAMMVITFDVADSVNSISFDFLFGSEEYPEWVGSDFNDVFGAYLNGTQISFDEDGNSITINGPFFSSGNVQVPPTNGMEYDGSTLRLTTISPITSGSTNNTLILVICDAGDRILDSGVLLAKLAGDIQEADTTETGIVPVIEVTGGAACGDTAILQVGVDYAFTVSAYDNGDNNDVVTLTVDSIPEGAFLTPTLPLTGNPVITQFTWTPTTADQGIHTVVFTATDQEGLPPEVCELVLLVQSSTVLVPTVIEPDPVYVAWETALDTVYGSIYLGDLSDSYDVNDINLSSIVINGGIVPFSASVIPGHAPFTGEVCEILFPMPGFILSYGLVWDTAYSLYEVSGQFDSFQPFLAEGSVAIIGHISGDLNSDGVVDIGDMVCLVEFLFGGGPPPRMLEAADINGSGGEPNVSDLVYLINWMFNGGSPPKHP